MYIQHCQLVKKSYDNIHGMTNINKTMLIGIAIVNIGYFDNTMHNAMSKVHLVHSTMAFLKTSWLTPKLWGFLVENDRKPCTNSGHPIILTILRELNKDKT